MKTDGREKIRQWIILLIGYGICIWFNIWFALVLLLFSLYIFLAGRLLEKTLKRPVLWLFIPAFPVLLWLFLKLFGTSGSGWVRFALPVGISFYLLRGISYLADLSSGKLKERYGFREVSLYLSFFPSLIAGPIALARDFLPQTRETHKLQWKRACDGGQRILWGIFQKLVIADRLGLAVDSVYAAPGIYSGLSLLLTALAYAIQIFFDFAGYTDIALGISTILGYDLPENFNLPYLAKDPSEFWRRWHISLSTWFREYVYIPLGGSRKGEIRACVNVILVMLISGIWHGSGWHFLVWGGYWGIGQALHRIWRRNRKGKDTGAVGRFLSVAASFLFAAVGWIFFRADSIGQALTVLRRILCMAEGVRYYYVYTPAFLLILLALQLFALKSNGGNMPRTPLDLSKFTSKLVICALIVLTISFAYFGQNAFIYGGF